MKQKSNGCNLLIILAFLFLIAFGAYLYLYFGDPIPEP